MEEKPNIVGIWKCEYCWSANYDSKLDCVRCGAPRPVPEPIVFGPAPEHKFQFMMSSTSMYDFDV